MSDGTTGGTLLVKDIAPGTDWGLYRAGLVEAEGRLFFGAGAEFGRELWTSDGTDTGTIMVADIWTGSRSSVPEQLLFVPAS